VATTTQGIAAEGDNEVGSLPGATKGPAQQILHYLKPILRANTELRIANAELGEECKRMSEAYKNVEAIAAEAALYRKELEESRKEVHVDLEMVRFRFQGLEPRTRTGGSAVLICKNRTAPRFYAVLSRFEPHGTATA
jgi:hypothetical protein